MNIVEKHWVEMPDGVKLFAELLLKRNPDAGEAVLSALEAFASGER